MCQHRLHLAAGTSKRRISRSTAFLSPKLQCCWHDLPPGRRALRCGKPTCTVRRGDAEKTGKDSTCASAPPSNSMHVVPEPGNPAEHWQYPRSTLCAAGCVDIISSPSCSTVADDAALKIALDDYWSITPLSAGRTGVRSHGVVLPARNSVCRPRWPPSRVSSIPRRNSV